MIVEFIIRGLSMGDGLDFLPKRLDRDEIGVAAEGGTGFAQIVLRGRRQRDGCVLVGEPFERGGLTLLCEDEPLHRLEEASHGENAGDEVLNRHCALLPLPRIEQRIPENPHRSSRRPHVPHLPRRYPVVNRPSRDFHQVHRFVDRHGLMLSSVEGVEGGARKRRRHSERVCNSEREKSSLAVNRLESMNYKKLSLKSVQEHRPP